MHIFFSSPTVPIELWLSLVTSRSLHMKNTTLLTYSTSFHIRLLNVFHSLEKSFSINYLKTSFVIETEFLTDGVKITLLQISSFKSFPVPMKWFLVYSSCISLCYPTLSLAFAWRKEDEGNSNRTVC